jgi:mannosylglycoprotein endo-beta-mannosidase
VGNVKLQIAIANIIVLRFDAAQERRQLTQGERWLRNTLKLTVLGLSSLERTIARQRSRLRWLKEGDANTKLFHAVANGRRAKNFIPAIKVGERIFTHQREKEEAFFQAYSALIGEVRNRENSVNLESLGFQPFELDDLEEMFTSEEVWKVIRDMPPDRAPGPDGFIGLFYQKAWEVIRGDIMAGILKLGVGDGRGFGKLNRSLITLIPKRPDALEVGDFRPISLVHSFGKLFSKLLANRLRTRLGDLVSTNQSAFVKGRCLHDNFILVRQVTRQIYKRKVSGVFLKLDLSRAFDSLSWAFLFEVLRQLGFGGLFLRWISLLLSTASVKILLNGSSGKSIKLVRGLR